jgi:hypothetical protein
MTSPNLGASWVYPLTSGSAAQCAYYCATLCALCVREGTAYSCSRSAILTLP